MEVYRSVVAAIGFGAGAETVARRAAGLARLYGADLTLMHVLEHFPEDRSNDVIPPEDRDPEQYELDEARSRLVALAESIGCDDCRFDVRECRGPAGEGIRACLESGDHDLLVLGGHDRHGLRGRLPRAADGAVRGMVCDVLLVRLD